MQFNVYLKYFQNYEFEELAVVSFTLFDIGQNIDKAQEQQMDNRVFRFATRGQCIKGK